MKILILSWRDIKHPYGGGAELLSHEMAKRWALQGHQVTHFSASFPGSKNLEKIDGVSYIRDGDWYNVHVKAFFKIKSGQLPKADIVIDEVHGIPFFSYLYCPVPVVCLACEVAQEIWDQMYKFPLNLIGKILEGIYLWLYKRVKFLTISDSTKSDLILNGIDARNITVLPMGFTYSSPSKIPTKEKQPTLIFLGRLAKSKGVTDAIIAFSIVKKNLPKSTLWIVGKGTDDYEKELKKLVAKLKLTKSVEFKGFVSEKEKFKLLARAHIILVPSIREGWGLIVPEANLVGTPAIVYNVAGLRDVTKTGRNGIIVKENSPPALAEAAIKLISNPKDYKNLSNTAKKFAHSLNWDETAKIAIKVLEQTYQAGQK